MATIDDFEKIDIRLGVITAVEDFPEARKPSYKLTIDFGPEIGIKHSAGRFTKNYAKEQLIGMKILGVVNFPPRHIGSFISETLTLGVSDNDGEVILVTPASSNALVGSRLF